MTIQPQEIPSFAGDKNGRFAEGSILLPWETSASSQCQQSQTEINFWNNSCDLQLNNKRKSSNVSKGPSKKKRKRTKKSIDQPTNKKNSSGACSLTSKGFRRHYAEHNYHDYSQVRPSDVEPDASKGSRGGVHNPFPSVLHRMMEEADQQNFSEIISWQSHGRAFLIHEPKVFVSEVLPKYFKHSKLSSFQRQLSLYGFVRLTQDGSDRGAYYHECFLRGRSFLCNKIVRTRVKGTWVRTSSSPESEPNFYAMESVRDLDNHNDEGASSSSSSRDGEDQSSTSSSSSSSLDDSFHQVVQNHIGTALEICSSSELQHGSPKGLAEELYSDTRIRSNNNSFAVQESMIDIGGLMPPPALPKSIVTTCTTNYKFEDPPRTHTRARDLTSSFSPSKLVVPSNKSMTDFNNKPMSLLSTLGSSTSFSSSTFFAPIADDTELAQFLTDVDLDTDFDTDDVLQVLGV